MWLLPKNSDELMDADTMISKRIVNYLRKRPSSADTLEGIVEWWLSLEDIDYTVDIIAKALDELIREGCIIRVRTENGNRNVYRLAK